MTATNTAATKFKPDVTREIVETVAVVLALVSLLRTFVAEAFSIPTGSMAPTLLGANRHLACPQCGYAFTVNAAEEAERGEVNTLGGVCQNCRFPVMDRNEGFVRSRSPTLAKFLLGERGDMVVVAKYEFQFRPPRRWDVTVFKYPAEDKPQQNTYPSRTNFIKRLVGLPGDELMVYYGDLLVRRPGEKEFAIAAKPPAAMLSTRRLVFDNDLQPSDLTAANFPARWTAQGAVKSSADRRTFDVTGDGELAYRHTIGGAVRDRLPIRIAAGASELPQLVTDFESYNRPFGAPKRAGMNLAFEDLGMIDPPIRGVADGVMSNWVGDLMLEATVALRKSAGAVALELREGKRLYRCEFKAGGGGLEASLSQDGKEIAKQTGVAAGATFAVRFANFDDRLAVWVDDRLVFGDGVPVARLEPQDNGPTQDELQPARIRCNGVDGAIRGVRLYRDIYYTLSADHGDQPFVPQALGANDGGEIDAWRNGLATTFADRLKAAHGEPHGRRVVFTVPAGHYMMCGDNSPRSNDSRFWQLQSFVPQECILGKAVVVYWPIELPPWLPRFVN